MSSRFLSAGICGGSALPAGSGAAAPAPSGDVGELARRVIAGEFGNGDERRRRLGANYAAVQARVNEILGGGARDVRPAVLLGCVLLLPLACVLGHLLDE